MAGDSSCFSVWSTFPSFFSVFESLCWFLHIRYIATSPSLTKWLPREDGPCESSGLSVWLPLKPLWFSKPSSLFLVAPFGLGCAKSCQCPKDVGDTHTYLGSQMTPNFCPFGFQLQANWESDLQAAAGKFRTLDMWWRLWSGETRSWGFLPTPSVLSQCHWECLCTQIELLVGFGWSSGIRECWTLLATRARWFGSQSHRWQPWVEVVDVWTSSFLGEARDNFTIEVIQEEEVGNMPTSSFMIPEDVSDSQMQAD